MRIISGERHGAKLLTPKGIGIRPTRGRVKEALFNILNNRIDFTEIMVLDLFSGTGNISYEFSSRGSKKIISVDKNAVGEPRANVEFLVFDSSRAFIQNFATSLVSIYETGILSFVT